MAKYPHGSHLAASGWMDDFGVSPHFSKDSSSFGMTPLAGLGLAADSQQA